MPEEHDHLRKDMSKAAWTKIFMGFKLALDPKKLLLGGVGIFVTFVGWWALSAIFYGMSAVPKVSGYTELKKPEEQSAYLKDCLNWSLLHEMAGTEVEKQIITAWEAEAKKPSTSEAHREKIKEFVQSIEKHPHGLLRACPWNEDRGPNQFLVVSQAIQNAGSGTPVLSPDEARSYLVFMIEPLYKFLLPVTYFFDSRAGWIISMNRIYLVLAMFWMIAVWGFFGGAITRMATVQLARNEKVGLRESLEFVLARWQGYVFAPVLPLLALFVLSLVLLVAGFFFGVTFALGDVLGGLLWPLGLLVGLVMTVILVGLVGWPLMNATISTEGSDSFDALSRSYSYVYQVPWYCAFYTALAVAYGAVLVFFVGFMGSLIVYLTSWGVEQAHFIEWRDPAYLYIYAPESFGWRELLLKDSPQAKELKSDPDAVLKGIPLYSYLPIGTYLVTFWLGMFFLLVIGFGYSFFWCAASIIYLLLRQKVDDTDMDEVYLEEDEDKPFIPESPPQPPAAPPTASSTPPATTFTMVDAPAVRSTAVTQLAPPDATGAASEPPPAT